MKPFENASAVSRTAIDLSDQDLDQLLFDELGEFTTLSRDREMMLFQY